MVQPVETYLYTRQAVPHLTTVAITTSSSSISTIGTTITTALTPPTSTGETVGLVTGSTRGGTGDHCVHYNDSQYNVHHK